jgi:uncharacterized membrane protein
MVTTYTVLKTVHVLAAVAWVGGGALLVMLLARARRAGDSGTLVALVRQLQFVGPRVFAPSGLVLVGTGIWMVLDGDGRRTPRRRATRAGSSTWRAWTSWCSCS